MTASTQSRLAVIRTTLARDYGLHNLEVDILSEDIVANLMALCTDLRPQPQGDDGQHPEDALAALDALAHNLNLDWLIRLSETLGAEQNSRQGKAYAKALKDLNNAVKHVDELVSSRAGKPRLTTGDRYATQSGKENNGPGRGR